MDWNKKKTISKISQTSTISNLKKLEIQFCRTLKMQNSKTKTIHKRIISMKKHTNNKSQTLKSHLPIFPNTHLLKNKKQKKQMTLMHSTAWLRTKWTAQWFQTMRTRISTGLAIRKITNNKKVNIKKIKLSNKASVISRTMNRNICLNLKSQPMTQKLKLLLNILNSLH